MTGDEREERQRAGGRRAGREANRLPLAAGPLPRALLRREGFSLIELLLAATAGLLLLGVAVGTLSDLRRGFARQQERSARQQDTRIGLAVLASELRLAGVGTSRAGRPLLSARPSSLSFLANLSSRSTRVTRAIAAQDREVAVRDGRGWRKGKAVVLCAASRCVRARLARNGRRHALDLTRPLGTALPSGSQVVLANHVRYYVKPDGEEGVRLMRMVDGGFSTVLERAAAIRFTYCGPDGEPAEEDGRISKVRIDLAPGGNLPRIHREVAVGG